MTPHSASTEPVTVPAAHLPGAAWAYDGVWAVLTRFFRVPSDPPRLPNMGGENQIAMRPSSGYLRYLKFFFWLLLLPMDIAPIVIWIVIGVAWLPGALIFAPVFLIWIIAPDIVAYVAIHLRYDTTWYVMTDRSIRLRRGIWVISETTITFENVQNIAISQGPLQRYFGIADIVIQTAGGGGGGHGKHGSTDAHTGIIQGIENAQQLRDSISDRVRAARHAGLGDEHASESSTGAWSAGQIEALRQVLAAARDLRCAAAVKSGGRPV